MKKKVNVAMIGHRFMGKAHSNAWRQVHRFFDVPFEPVMKAICGRNEQEVKKAADTFGWEEHCVSWERLVERKDIDVIHICTPGDTHLPIAVAAAQAKKVVFCEKPLANTLVEARQMLDAVRSNAVMHMICFNYRRAPAVALARQVIAEGSIGKIHTLSGHVFAGLDY